jgi:NTP pyrophosphatase (non-canonical NTP hydrolase)
MSSNSFVTIGIAVVRYDQFVKQLFKADCGIMMKMHAALGVCGEAGELADAIKKEVVYGKPEDMQNLIEELGDLRFYMQAVQNLYGITEQDILQYNANKLSKRYSSLRYSNEEAIRRADKQKESDGS